MLLLIVLSFAFYYMAQTTWLSFEFWNEGEKSKSVVMRNLGLILAAIVGLFIAIFRGIIAHRNNAIAEKTQVTTAFTAAIAQLGNEGLSIRLGGIYALGQIGQDHPKQYKSVVSNTLQAFIRSTSYHGKSYIEHNNDNEAGGSEYQEAEQEKIAHLMDEEDDHCWLQERQERDRLEQEYSNFLPKETGEDISAALMTIGQLKVTQVNLPNTFLVGAALQGCFLQGANFHLARLDNADLQRSNLKGANFGGIAFQVTSMKAVNLEDADLQCADLRNANLEGANLLGADLNGAKLKGANLDGAMFWEVSGLTLQMITSAKSWEGIQLNAELEWELADYMGKSIIN